MTPLHIKILLHYYTTDQLIEHHSAQAVVDYTAKLIALGALKPRADMTCATTPLGDAWVRLICSTPVPKACFCDPRTDEVIKEKI